MKVAVVTPYFREPIEKLRRCHDSVRAQSHACAHVMIADGHPNPEVAAWPVEHIVLPTSHGDYGNTPRSIGAMSAMNRGFDAIAYLDADNWMDPDHVESLVALAKTRNVPLAFSDRHLVALDGSILANMPEDDHPDHIDTNCVLHTMQAARLIPVWAMMEPALALIGDRIILGAAKRLGLNHARTGRKTVHYETSHRAHYVWNDRPPPPQARQLDVQGALEAYSAERCVERLGFAFTVTGPERPVPPPRPARSGS